MNTGIGLLVFLVACVLVVRAQLRPPVQMPQTAPHPKPVQMHWWTHLPFLRTKTVDTIPVAPRSTWRVVKIPSVISTEPLIVAIDPPVLIVPAIPPTIVPAPTYVECSTDKTIVFTPAELETPVGPMELPSGQLEQAPSSGPVIVAAQPSETPDRLIEVMVEAAVNAGFSGNQIAGALRKNRQQVYSVIKQVKQSEPVTMTA